MKKYGSVRVVSREHSWDIADHNKILGGDLFSFGSIIINLNEDRLACFRKSGFVCAACKRSGRFIALEYVESKSYSGYSLNVYSDDGAYFTKDHIIPKSLGGKDSLDNYQTMCWKCNANKGSKISS